jgi:hypothetical protein
VKEEERISMDTNLMLGTPHIWQLEIQVLDILHFDLSSNTKIWDRIKPIF